MENANEFLFHPSAMGAIMTSLKKPVEEGVTTMRELVKRYRQIKWKRLADTGNKYTEKGLEVEEDGLTLYSKYKGIFLTKNNIRLKNDYFNGEIDSFIGEEILRAKHTIDIKCVWSWLTFPSFIDKADSDYDYQGQAYMDLCGAETHTVAYCLVNTPANLIEKEIRNLAWALGVGETDPVFIEQAKEVEKNSIVDMELFKKHFPDYVVRNTEWTFDIPANERVYELVVKRDEEKISAMKKRCDDCRIWLNNNCFI